jgi:hypothetical protein
LFDGRLAWWMMRKEEALLYVRLSWWMVRMEEDRAHDDIVLYEEFFSRGMILDK